MNLALERRLAALEAVNRAANDFTLIVLRIITPGVEAGEAAFATALGQRFTRESSETEDEFIDRIHAYAEANCHVGHRGVQVIVDDHEFEQ